MEDRKLLDAQVFNRTAEIAETIVTNFFILCGFLRVLFHFTLSIILRFKKHSCSISFCRKNDSQFDKKKELQSMRDERE